MKLRNKKTGEIRPAEAREDGVRILNETLRHDVAELCGEVKNYERPM